VRPVVVPAGRSVISVGSAGTPACYFDPSMKPNGRWRD